MIFDLIASQYGLTFQQVSEMTLHEVSIAIDAISARRKQEIKLQASFLGATFKDEEEEENRIEEVEMTDAHKRAMEKAIAEQIKMKGLKHV